MTQLFFRKKDRDYYMQLMVLFGGKKFFNRYNERYKKIVCSVTGYFRFNFSRALGFKSVINSSFIIVEIICKKIYEIGQVKV